MIDVLREMQKKKMMLVKASKTENIHKKEYDALTYVIEKQTPKKPNEGLFCPNCNGIDLWDSWGDELNYCGDCGQKLDWSESGDP